MPDSTPRGVAATPETKPARKAEARHEAKPQKREEDERFVVGGAAEEIKPAAAQREIDAEAGLFDNRQKQYLLGRTVTKNIMDKNGNIIAEEGDKITDKIINGAREAGRMVHLVMNNRA
jgi:hypothetical protein